MRATFEMTEAHQARVLKTIEDMVQSLERNHIRKLQVSGHVNAISAMFKTSNIIQYIVQCIINKSPSLSPCVHHLQPVIVNTWAYQVPSSKM